MKILYDHQIFALQKFGGISRYFNEIMKLENDNFKVCSIDPVLFRQNEVHNKQDFFSRGERFVKRKLGVLNSTEVPAFPSEAKAVFAKEDYDIFHPTYYDPYFLGMNSKPFVLTVYDMIHEIYKEYFPAYDMDSSNKRNLCVKAERIIAISHKTKEDLIDIFNIPEEKISVTHLASDFDKYEASTIDIAHDLKKYILFVGNRGLYKNFYFTMIALSEVLKSDLNLQVLCTGHAFTSAEINFFKDLGIEKQVLNAFLRSDNDLAWAYKNAAMFIFPSLYEGFGLPILEAFASNCPVVTSNGGSLPEVAGDAALYFEPKNLVQIRDAVTTVLYNRSVQKDLIDKGQKRYKEFSWDKCRSETRQIYSSLL
ncbi:glycosyltransferase family 4 protein [Hymenobacter volaticus]|uniref:Glycosyltransferase family 4 protein n=1 Tax=Hymenobacter volaticus TaxID=2932254 RepID=A0ABY4G8I2_9BACT|nr:glycosyltransferase family 1 protein [Hymenobacter volaticus]UOQ67215.1 glycosyltransferase family 4 protein [Hymenobacter volaticus]